LERSVSFNEATVLSKETEEVMLNRDMQTCVHPHQRMLQNE
jgi:outer membrane lipopolysaccharide assembly protein LptE/RlpB